MIKLQRTIRNVSIVDLDKPCDIRGIRLAFLVETCMKFNTNLIG